MASEKPSPPASESLAGPKEDQAVTPVAPPAAGRPDIKYPGQWLYLILAIALLLAMFLVALDMASIFLCFGRMLSHMLTSSNTEHHCHRDPNHYNRISQR